MFAKANDGLRERERDQQTFQPSAAWARFAFCLRFGLPIKLRPAKQNKADSRLQLFTQHTKEYSIPVSPNPRRQFGWHISIYQKEAGPEVTKVCGTPGAHTEIGQDKLSCPTRDADAFPFGEVLPDSCAGRNSQCLTERSMPNSYSVQLEFCLKTL